MGLSTHVLDLTSGAPAEGLSVTLFIDSDEIAKQVTDSDGRCPDLRNEANLVAGRYRLLFKAGDYFKRAGRETFYEDIPVEFLINDTARHYHVPLLLSPFGYSTYRGS